MQQGACANYQAIGPTQHLSANGRSCSRLMCAVFSYQVAAYRATVLRQVSRVYQPSRRPGVNVRVQNTPLGHWARLHHG